MQRLLPLLLLALSAAAPAASLSDLGLPIQPHGFPAFYTDSNGLSLEPAVPRTQVGIDALGNRTAAGNSTRPDLCIFTPVNPANPDSVKLGVGNETFWWSAVSTMTMPGGGLAILTYGLEGSFPPPGSPVDGQQIAFSRIRIRIDTPTPGTYTVTHPYGVKVFPNLPAGKKTINYTIDTGAINPLLPALSFRAALSTPLAPFLTWPDYANDPSLQVPELNAITGLPTGKVLEQYIGNPVIPHTVIGSPFGTNVFRVQGPGVDVSTNLFAVMGKVYDPSVSRIEYVYPASPVPNLFAVGPVNRVAPVNPVTVGAVTGQDYAGYPVGYPLWYQDTVLVTDNFGSPVIDPVTRQQQRAGGLQLTFCPASDPMCVTLPLDPADPNQVRLRIGKEGFFWSATALVDAKSLDVTNLPAGLDGRLDLGLEGAFGQNGAVVVGMQIGFARVRIRVTVPVDGDYTITHPYGQIVFPGVSALVGIKYTGDVMIFDPNDPDGAFIGATYGKLGPRFLTWDTFDPDPAKTDPNLNHLANPGIGASPLIRYIGDPAIAHAIKGSTTGNDLFRIQGPNGIDVRTRLFLVSGKLFDPATFNPSSAPGGPQANPDTATLDLGQAAAVTIPVTANDFLPAGFPVTVSITTVPGSGTAIPNNPAGTVTYFPNPASVLARQGGLDTFTYSLTVTGSNPPIVSNNGTVSVTVIPVPGITVTRALFDTRRLQLDLQGTGNVLNSTLTIYPGAGTAAPPIGTATVNARGRWTFRGAATANLTEVTFLPAIPGGSPLTQPLQLR